MSITNFSKSLEIFVKIFTCNFFKIIYLLSRFNSNIGINLPMFYLFCKFNYFTSRLWMNLTVAKSLALQLSYGENLLQWDRDITRYWIPWSVSSLHSKLYHIVSPVWKGLISQAATAFTCASILLHDKSRKTNSSLVTLPSLSSYFIRWNYEKLVACL